MTLSNAESRAVIRQILETCLVRRAACLSEADLGRSAAVFAPHPDDETLGCGGMIALKRRVGADVRVVFMTDGRRSNRRLMPEEEIRAIRRDEALAAAKTLGVDPDRLTFLDFQNGMLAQVFQAARQKVGQILEEEPEEVLIPYHGEPRLASDEHRLTNQIVTSVLESCKRVRYVYEYPIWLWNRWPWVPVPQVRLRRRIRFLLASARCCVALFQDFRYCVDARSVLDLKKAALDCHRSQMTRIVPDERWRTLPDVGNGEFLRCFLGGYEFFSRHRIPR